MTTPEPSEHAHRIAVRYTGRVQGVGFRATAEEIARSYEITGFVINEPDGSVHLEAQGHRDDVDGFLSRVQERMSTLVDDAVQTPLGLDRDEQAFEIRY